MTRRRCFKLILYARQSQLTGNPRLNRIVLLTRIGQMFSFRNGQERVREMHGRRVVAQTGSLALFLLACLGSCERNHPALEGSGEAAPATEAGAGGNGASAIPSDPRLQQAFAEAIR